jgi:hypothetical protein
MASRRQSLMAFPTASALCPCFVLFSRQQGRAVIIPFFFASDRCRGEHTVSFEPMKHKDKNAIVERRLLGKIPSQI